MNINPTSTHRSRFNINPQSMIPDDTYLPTFNPKAQADPSMTYANSHIYSQTQKVPFQATRVEYEEREVIDKVPVQKIITEYKTVKKMRSVPKERFVQDHYAVEHQISYVPVIVPETRIQYVAVEVQSSRLQYIPYTRDIVHFPQATMPIQRQQSIDVSRGTKIPEDFTIDKSLSFAARNNGSMNWSQNKRTQGISTPTRRVSAHKLESKNMSTNLKVIKKMDQSDQKGFQMRSLASVTNNGMEESYIRELK